MLKCVAIKALRGTGFAGPQQEPPRGAANEVSVGVHQKVRTFGGTDSTVSGFSCTGL